MTQRLLGDTVVIDDVGPARRGRAYPTVGTAFALLFPAAALLGAIVVWPVLRTLHASVTDPDTGGFVGLEHFRTALAAEGAWTVVGRTLLWAAVVPAVVTILGYALAALLRRTADGRLVRLILVAPIALPLVVTGIVYRFMYDPEPRRGTATGLAAYLWDGWPEEGPSLLGPDLITVSLMSAFVWAWIGLAVVVFRAALDAIPHDLSDAVRAHGGTRLDVFRDAQWRPLLRRTVAVVFVLVALGTARTFDLILVMAPGSVIDEASVLAVRVWQTSGGTTSGPAAALGVLWLGAVALGVVGAALGSRQAWPPPVPAPSPPPAEPPKRALSVLRRTVPPLAAAVWILPLVVLFAISLHAPRDAATRGWWSAPVSLQSYQDMFTGGAFVRSLGFTAALAAVVTLAVLTVAMLAAYPLARMVGPSASVAGVLLLATAVVPVQVIAGPINEVLALVSSAGSAPGLALVHVALGLPFAILVLRNGLADVPVAQVRQARLASYRQWTTVWRLARTALPAVLAVAVLEYVQVWNDLVVGLLFSGPDGTPLGQLLYGQARQFVANSGPLAAGSVFVSMLPVLLIVLARRQVVAGLVSGAIR